MGEKPIRGQNFPNFSLPKYFRLYSKYTSEKKKSTLKIYSDCNLRERKARANFKASNSKLNDPYLF